MRKLLTIAALAATMTTPAMAEVYWFNGSEEDTPLNLGYNALVEEVGELMIGDIFVYQDALGNRELSIVNAENSVKELEANDLDIETYKDDADGLARLNRIFDELNYLNDTGVPFGTRWQKIVSVAGKEGWGDILAAYITTMNIKNPNHHASVYHSVHEFLTRNVDHFLDPALEKEITAAISKTIDFSTFADNEEAYTQGFNDGWRAAETHHGITNN